MKRIYMFYPFMPESVIPKVAEVLRSRWIGQGPKVDEFEREFAEKFGLSRVVSVNTGTSALRLVYAVSGIGPGDEVISPALTCTATNTPILEQFAKPVFADVQYESANLDPNDVEHRITDKTKAIVCVHWGGYPCDMKELREIADSHGLKLIADGAHALGAEYQGKPVGICVDFTVFSLGAIKQITTADGGMISVMDEGDYKACIRRRWYGIDKASRKPTVLGHDPTYDISEVGYKYNMNDITAAIGLEQLKYFDEVLARRRQITRWYREELEGTPNIELFEERKNRKSAYWLFTMHIKDRLKFAENMWKKGVEVSVAHWRNDKYTIFGPMRKDLPNTDKLHEDMMCIPLHNKLTDEDVSYIIKVIKNYERARK